MRQVLVVATFRFKKEEGLFTCEVPANIGKRKQIETAETIGRKRFKHAVKVEHLDVV